MRVLILTPTAFPTISGNAVTAERWRRALAGKGITAEVLATAELDVPGFLKHLERFRPDLIHAHHAFKAGALLVDSRVAPRVSGIPLVTSPGGTDLNEDLANPARRDTVLKVLQIARAVVAQSADVVRTLERRLPALKDRIVFVPKAVCWFGDDDFDLRGAAECTAPDILFLLPSGIRPVKGNLECLSAMARVHEIRPEVRFVAAGPAVDPGYADDFRREILRLSSFARWIETIPSSAMRSAYRETDIVLNASLSEGLSNSLIEAIAAGRPVLASDIPGNRWPVLGEEGDVPAGLLFDLHSTEDFVRKAVSLIDDGALRRRLGRAWQSRQSTLPGAADEADRLIGAYRAALNNCI